MSRAFVSESDMEYEGDIPVFKSPLPKGARNYTTPEGARKLQDEINTLVEDERPKLSGFIARLLSEGDGADRNALKNAQYDIKVLDRKIEYLSGLMRTAEIVRPSPGTDKKRVTFGVRVEVRKENNEINEYRIVGVYESNPEEGLISWISPVAKALLGASIGDTVTLHLPEKEEQVKVISIR